MKITDKDTILIVAGGNAGNIAGEALAGAAAGAASLAGANRSGLNIVVKTLFGIGMLTLAEKVAIKHGDLAQALDGMGTAPLYSVANEAIAAAVPGTNVADYVYAEVQKLLNPAAGPGAGARAYVARAPTVAYSNVAPAPVRRAVTTLGM